MFKIVLRKFSHSLREDGTTRGVTSKKIEQVTTTALGSRVVTVLEFKEFREENERFFIEIEQEDGTRFWTQKSFEFEEILGMGFVS